jgi:sugar (pentulose or hexulose) kinase
MESVAYEIKLVLEIFNRNGIEPKKIICLEKMDNLKSWHTIRSSCVNFPYTFINLEEPISYGAALISMLGMGRKDLFKNWVENRIEHRIEPQKELSKTYEKTLTKYIKAVKSTLKYYK